MTMGCVAGCNGATRNVFAVNLEPRHSAAWRGATAACGSLEDMDFTSPSGALFSPEAGTSENAHFPNLAFSGFSRGLGHFLVSTASERKRTRPGARKWLLSPFYSVTVDAPSLFRRLLKVGIQCYGAVFHVTACARG